MTRKKGILFIIFVILFFIMFSFSLYLNKSNRFRKTTYQELDRRLDELRETEVVDNEKFEDLKTRYLWTLSRYRDDKNLYLFSQSVKEALEKEGISILRYSRREQSDENFIEFTVAGNIESFFRFLRIFSRESQAFKIPYFTIDTRDGGCQITFLIGFDMINEELFYDLPLTEGFEWSGEIDLLERIDEKKLASIFYREVRNKTVVSPDPVIENKVPEKLDIPVAPLKIYHFQYVGKVGTLNGIRYYIKELDSGRIITLPSTGWTLMDQDGQRIKFRHENSVYEVPVL